MFIDRIMVTGLAIAGLTTALAAIALTLAVIYLLNLPVPQVVRLVGLVPSPGSVILDDVGDSASLSVQGYYSDQTLADLEADFITYESTDPSVVSVSPDGVVTANGAGGADIVIGFGSFSKSVHALVFGDIPMLPPIDPAMVGPIPGLDEEVRAVLNRVIVELNPGYDTGDAEDIAAELGGEVVFSYSTFPGHVIEFDTEAHSLVDVLAGLGADPRLDVEYADVLFEALDHPIDTLDLHYRVGAYIHTGFEGAWRMMERVPQLDPVSIWILEVGHLDVADKDEPAVIREEFDPQRIHIPSRLVSLLLSTDEHTAAVTGVIAARNHEGAGANVTNNFSGIVSSVPNLKYDIISLNRDPTWIDLVSVLYELEQIETIQSSTSTIDVANMSFGSGSGLLGNLRELANLGSMKRIIRGMSDVTFVTGAGNDPIDAQQGIPAKYSQSFDNVITVGGANRTYDGRWVDSGYGGAVTLAAPAEEVWSVAPPSYSFFNGTSFAAPMVTGTVALLKAIDPDATPADLRKLLVETGDRKQVCTSSCDEKDKEWWHFLRADKAVAKLLSDRIDAEIETGRVVVPGDAQRVVGHRIDFGFDIVNTGEMEWPFYAEAFLRDPNGSELRTPTAENVVAPDKSHQFRWGFWPLPNASGCWDVRVKVWTEPPMSSDLQDVLVRMRDTLVKLGLEDEIEDIDDLLKELNDPGLLNEPVETKDIGYMRAALAELTGVLNSNVEIEDIGLLADSGWIEEVIEVRAAPDQPVQCSGSDKAIPLAIPISTGQVGTGAKANVLLLADTSGSMEGQKAAALQEAIQIFANRMSDIRLEAKGGIDSDPDYVGLTDFDSGYREVLSLGPIDPAGADVDAWEDAVNSLDADGGTALYDAIIRSIDALEEQGAPARKNILIALTDGLDQDSRSSLGDAISRLDQSSVTLFALALSEPGGTGDYDFGVLQELANATRGAAYAADTENLSGLYELFSTIFEIEP